VAVTCHGAERVYRGSYRVIAEQSRDNVIEDGFSVTARAIDEDEGMFRRLTA